MSYEESIESLEKIVKQLSDENLSIEKSIELYSEGLKVAKECLATLGEFKNKIEALNLEFSKISFDATTIKEND